MRRSGATSHLMPWALAFFIVVNSVVLDWAIGPFGSSLVLLTLLNAAACFLLAKRLTGPVTRTLWVWPLFVYFLIGYFLNMTRFALHVDSPGYVNTNYTELRWVTRERIVEGYPWITLGFVVFCLVAAVALKVLGSSVGAIDRAAQHQVSRRRVSQAMVCVFGLYLLVTLVQIKVGYGVLGAPNPRLPFRAGSFMTLFQRSFVPAVLLLAVWIFDSLGGRRANLAALLAVACGALDSYASTSRGALLAISAPLLFLWLLTRRFDLRRKVAIAGVLLAVVALFPVLSSLRSERLTGEPAAERPDPLPTRMVSSGLNVVTRVGAGGADSLWAALDHRANFSIDRSAGLLLPGRLGRYFTQTVVGVKAPNDNRAAGVIASLMMIGSAAGVVVGMLAMVPLSGVLWAKLSRLRTAPVVLALLVMAIVVFFQSLDATVLVKFLLQAATCEVVYRKIFVVNVEDVASPAPMPALVAA